MPGQISIEEDFPEYMPDAVGLSSPDLQEKKYAMSHKETEPDEEQEFTEEPVVKGTYKEMVTFPWKTTQPELPILKNADQRKEWLSKYKEWGLWYRDENIDVNYYKFDFEDGSRLVVEEHPQRHSYYSREVRDEAYYHLLAKNKVTNGEVYDEKYRHATHSETALVEFLKNLQKR